MINIPDNHARKLFECVSTAVTGFQAEPGPLRDSDTDRGKVNPLIHAPSMKSKPTGHKAMYFGKKLSSAVFLHPLNCMSGADASCIKRERSIS